MASYSQRCAPAEWAAKRQAAIEAARVKKESERLGEITDQHTFRPARRATSPHSVNAEVTWQASATVYVAKRRAAIKAETAKKDAERRREAQSMQRRSPSRRMLDQRKSQSTVSLKADADKPMVQERCTSPRQAPIECCSNVVVVEDAPIVIENICTPAVTLVMPQAPAMRRVTMAEAVATASPLRQMARQAHERARPGLKSPVKSSPRQYEETLAALAEAHAAVADAQLQHKVQPFESSSIASPNAGRKIAWVQIAVHTDAVSPNLSRVPSTDC